MERNRRALSWILVLVLLITCTISGLVLPVAAEATVTSGTVVKLEDFEGGSYWNGITKWTAKGEVTADPLDDTNKVLKLTSAASAVYNGAKMSEVAKGKVYALSIDFYGGTGIKLQFNESGKKVYGATTMSVSAASEWKTATYFFVTTSSSTIDGYLMHLTAPVGTCIDNIKLVELGSKGDINNLENGMLPGGDFEWPNTAPWNKFSSSTSPVMDDPTGAENKVLYFKNGYTASSGVMYQQKLGLAANTTYELSVDVYGDKIWAYLNSAKGISSGAGWIELSGKGDGWRTVKHTFKTGASVTDDINVFGFGTPSGSATGGNGVYIDNIKIKKKYADSIVLDRKEISMTVGDAPITLSATAFPEGMPLAEAITWTSSDNAVATVVDGVVTAVGAGTATITATSGELTASCTVTVQVLMLGTLNADITLVGGTIVFDGANTVTAQVGTIVSVTAQPADGYVMKPGSLKYVSKDGTEVKILNQSLTDSTFGGGTGHTFEVKMPEGTAEVTAEFVSADNTTFLVDTIGTSLHETEWLGYDGIRFLTRMNLATTFDPNADALTVKYNGVDYEIVEIGSLLKRYEEGVELTIDNKRWQSKAYVKGGTMSLIDYTDSYIDFTVVMMKGSSLSSDVFKARQYTARGYVVLEGENGDQVTLLSNTQLTNSVNDILEKQEEANYFSPILRFAVTGDVHIRTTANDLMSKDRLAQFYETAYAYSESQTTYDKLDGIFFVGDNTQNGSEAEQTYFFDYLKNNTKEGTVAQTVMGNHEFYATGHYTDESFAQAPLNFMQYSGYEAVDNHLVIGGYHFIFLSMDRYNKAGSDFFSPDKIAWLKQELDISVADTPDKPIFVFQHEAALNTMKHSGTTSGDADLKTLLDDYPQVIDFSGHTHGTMSDPRTIWQGTFTALQTGSLCYLGVPLMGKTTAKQIDDEGNWATGDIEDAVRNGGMYYIVEIDANDTVRILTYNLFTNSLWGEPYIIDSLDPAEFTYTDARVERAVTPTFPEEAVLTAKSVSSKNLVVTIPQAEKCKDVVQSYRIEVYKGDTLVTTDYRTSFAHYGDAAPETVLSYICGLEPGAEYTVKVFATTSWSVDSEPLTLTVTIADDSGDAAADVLDVEFCEDGTAVNAATGRALATHGAPTVVYDETLGQYIASFDGVDDGYSFGGITNWYDELATSFTLETYVQLKKPSSSYVDIMSNQQAGGFGFEYTSAGKLLFYCNVNSAYAKPSTTIADGQWVHLTGTFDGSTVKLYVNGALVASETKAGTLTAPPYSSQFLCIGADSGVQQLTAFFGGKVASAKLYSEVLTADEIAAAYAEIAQ